MVAIYEKFRPTHLEDFAGFTEVKQRLESLKECVGWDGQVFWISGMSGTGKTTLARIIANEVASDIDVEEIDAQDLKLERLELWRKRCAYYPQKQAYAFVVNEAHTLPTRTVSKLQTFLEEDHVQRNATVIFTTTDRGQQHLFDTRFDAIPFLSRAIMIDLVPDNATCREWVELIRNIEVVCGYVERTTREYEDLLTECAGNLRSCLQQIAITGKPAKAIA